MLPGVAIGFDDGTMETCDDRADHALPKTPLDGRLKREGRLKALGDANENTRPSANVIQGHVLRGHIRCVYRAVSAPAAGPLGCAADQQQAPGTAPPISSCCRWGSCSGWPHSSRLEAVSDPLPWCASPDPTLRAAIVPGPADHATEHAHCSPGHMSWARLLQSAFDLDTGHRPNCGGPLKIIAAMVDPQVIVKILTHLGLPARAPPRSPARPLPLFQAA